MRIAKAGWPFVLGGLLAAALLCGLASHFESVIVGMLAGVALLASAFCAYFFRDPPRVIPSGDQLIVSPADGKIVAIEEGTDPAYTDPVWVMRIFLSVFDPHIQRMPVAGRVEKIKYTKGKFLDARHPQAHFENEQNRLEIRPMGRPSATPIVVTQIAGLIARRIVCWVKEGETLKSGEQFGLIRFGSQVDIVFPKTVVFKVKAGDRVEAGSTVLAEAQ
jgi:phosphatidylserine decarboxylase